MIVLTPEGGYGGRTNADAAVHANGKLYAEEGLAHIRYAVDAVFSAGGLLPL